MRRRGAGEEGRRTENEPCTEDGRVDEPDHADGGGVRVQECVTRCRILMRMRVNQVL